MRTGVSTESGESEWGKEGMRAVMNVWHIRLHMTTLSKPTLAHTTLLTRTVATKIFVIVMETRSIKCQ